MHLEHVLGEIDANRGNLHVDGKVRLSALAVLRLISSSNVAGLLDRNVSRIGRTQDLVDYIARPSIQIAMVWSVDPTLRSL